MRSCDDVIGKAMAVLMGFAAASCAPYDERAAPGAAEARIAQARVIPTGPQADYPVVIGEPFAIDGITYTPGDTMNHDEVGYAMLDDPAARGITAAHRTLPLPSYVEITALETGCTILARVERRGPMTNARLVGLSPGAGRQLGVAEGAPIRVRRVNPPEDQRAELRAGNEAPLRMDTPEGLLTVLRRSLPAIGSASLTATAGPRAAQPQDIATGDAPLAPAQAEAVEPEDERPPSATPTGARPSGDWVVQAGAFSARASADRVAAEIGGYVEPVGRLWRVRAGPFATRLDANAALAKVRGAGYSGAQVYSIR